MRPGVPSGAFGCDMLCGMTPATIPLAAVPDFLSDRRRLFWTLQCGGFLLFGVVMYGWGVSYWGAVDAAVNKAILIASGFLLTLLMRGIYRRLRGRNASLLTVAASVLALSFSLAAVWLELENSLFHTYYRYWYFGQLELRFIALPFGLYLYYGLVLLSWSVIYFAAQAVMEAAEQRQRAQRAESMAQEARLQALRSQLEPHFLFNAMNAVSTLVAEGQNAAAQQMISRLSDFLRMTLERGSAPEITLAEELDLVLQFLAIEQVRFGDRLSVTVAADDAAQRAAVPTLILQPLVENAVKHGVGTLAERGVVTISARVEGDELLIEIADNGQQASVNGSKGIGLANTSERLAQLYGDRARVTLTRSQSGTTATVTLPYHPVNQAAAGAGAR